MGFEIGANECYSKVVVSSLRTIGECSAYAFRQ